MDACGGGPETKTAKCWIHARKRAPSRHAGRQAEHDGPPPPEHSSAPGPDCHPHCSARANRSQGGTSLAVNDGQLKKERNQQTKQPNSQTAKQSNSQTIIKRTSERSNEDALHGPQLNAAPSTPLSRGVSSAAGGTQRSPRSPRTERTPRTERGPE